MNFAAESHVDRSIDGPEDFIESNIVGVYTLLDAARDYLDRNDAAIRDTFRFLHVSTDEVFGSIERGAASEASPYAPSSPYARLESVGGPFGPGLAANVPASDFDHQLL